jgi:glutamate-1-semialdehyde 2,1-aminomutase
VAGGAQEKLSVNADLVNLWKSHWCRHACRRFWAAGKRIMQHIAPLGNVYQAGTLSGNPIAMIAGFTLLKELKNNPAIYDELDAKTKYLGDGY